MPRFSQALVSKAKLHEFYTTAGAKERPPGTVKIEKSSAQTSFKDTWHYEAQKRGPKKSKNVVLKQALFHLTLRGAKGGRKA